jgi:hypothetical protein
MIHRHGSAANPFIGRAQSGAGAHRQSYLALLKQPET